MIGPEPLLALRDVGFRYDRARPVLRGVSLAVHPGEAVGLFGANGAGKTTIARLAMAFLHPHQGIVTTVGRRTEGLAPEDLAADVGMLFQRPESQLFSHTVRDELAFGPTRFGWSGPETAERVQAIAGRLQLAADLDEHPYDLSPSRRRLVALGSAMVLGARLLILDEPTAGLDRPSRGVLGQALAHHLAAGGGILAITHDPRFAAETLDRGAEIAAGSVVAEGPISDLLTRETWRGAPRHPLTQLILRQHITPTTWTIPGLASAVVGHRA